MNKKVIVCDLDGTLAPSKSLLESNMADLICKIIENHKMAVISGGSYKQFQKQFLSQLKCTGDVLKNIFLFPTNGSTCYVYDGKSDFKQVYDEKLSTDEVKEIFSAFKRAIVESLVDVSNPYGELIEDRGGQVSFSGCGQDAPLEVKEKWDPDQKKRQSIIAILKVYIPDFEIRIGGATTIDVTHKGITKAYAIKKIEQILDVRINEMVFLGDALFDGGNDSSVRTTGVECISVSGPAETLEILKRYA